MQQIHLTPRLEVVKGMLPRCQTIADIGCDHGKLAVYLIQSDVCERVIATDVSPDSVRKTRKLVERAGVAQQVDIRLGNGLHVLSKGEAEAAVFAGMGGTLIAQLIHNSLDRAKEIGMLVLQPMQQAAILRRYLRENGFCITDEEMVREGRWIYEIISAKAGNQPHTAALPDELLDEIGPVLWSKRDPLIAARLEYKLCAIVRRLKEAQEGGTTHAQEGAKELKAQIQAYERILDEIKNPL